MIIIYHDGQKSLETSQTYSVQSHIKTLPEFLLATAELFPEELLVWCHIQQKPNLNKSELEAVFHSNHIMASYSPDEFLPEAIGYVEEGPFIPVCKKVTYPTWRMHALVGGIRAQVLLAMQNSLQTHVSFNYFLHSLAKMAMPLGLFCYSEPRLLKQADSLPPSTKAGAGELFKFVAQHYKKRWCFLLFLNSCMYDKKCPLWAFVRSLFYSKNEFSTEIFKPFSERKKVATKGETLDVVIPTLGRKKYLNDVLKDLSAQTHLPEKVIIVEQNPEPGSVSELDYLQTEKWPFKIVHHFTHQTGACQARNLALQEVTAYWVFLADDDIRFNEEFIASVLNWLLVFNQQAATFGCFQKNEKAFDTFTKQWPTFGSGCSVISSKLTKRVTFNTAFEYGYGEDADFGMQLRKMGVDVVYFPEPSILHLKAPVGGFRTKPKLPWQAGKIQPKPSPTVMLFKQLHQSREQILGYKTLLAVKFYRHQSIKNPFSYLRNFKKAWEVSEDWAKQLQNQHS